MGDDKPEGSAMVIACSASDFHPYECGGGCIHCEERKTETHDPDECWLCHSFDDEWIAARTPKEEP